MEAHSQCWPCWPAENSENLYFFRAPLLHRRIVFHGQGSASSSQTPSKLREPDYSSLHPDRLLPGPVHGPFALFLCVLLFHVTRRPFIQSSTSPFLRFLFFPNNLNVSSSISTRAKSVQKGIKAQQAQSGSRQLGIPPCGKRSAVFDTCPSSSRQPCSVNRLSAACRLCHTARTPGQELTV